MKKIFLNVLVLVMTVTSLSAQKHFTRSGKITFYSDAPLEKIEAQNNTATSVIDLESGRMEFAALIKAFQFEKALMQEHFNENYMESSKYPKATFKGQIKDMSKVDFTTDGVYQVVIAGTMTIHGVSKELEVPGVITTKDGKIKGTSSFEVAVADYEIEIPSVVNKNIAEKVQITVDMDYELFKKGS